MNGPFLYNIILDFYFFSGSVKSILATMLDRLERCQKSLNEFLEEKRSSFPRFYFIGDDDLLQILGQASKPVVIQTHLKKLFAGIYNVNFDQDNKHIITMNSIEGEIVPLKQKVRISSAGNCNKNAIIAM